MWFRDTTAELAGKAIISLVMSAVMSVFMIAVNAGLGSGYPQAYRQRDPGAVVSFPTALVVVPPPRTVRPQEFFGGHGS
jgi:hypothetical protein